jgi:hypothetical protein
MRTLAALVGVAAVALTPAAADAHHKSKSKSKVYKGSFQLVGADGSYTRDSFGKAHLVDGRRNDQLSVHVRKLGSRATYTFRLQSAATACEQGAAGGTDVPGWKYRRGGVLVTNRHGVANVGRAARGFKVDPNVEYFVGVFDSTNRLVACAQLTTSTRPRSRTPTGHVPEAAWPRPTSRTATATLRAPATTRASPRPSAATTARARTTAAATTTSRAATASRTDRGTTRTTVERAQRLAQLSAAAQYPGRGTLLRGPDA